MFISNPDNPNEVPVSFDKQMRLERVEQYPGNDRQLSFRDSGVALRSIDGGVTYDYVEARVI